MNTECFESALLLSAVTPELRAMYEAVSLTTYVCPSVAAADVESVLVLVLGLGLTLVLALAIGLVCGFGFRFGFALALAIDDAHSPGERSGVLTDSALPSRLSCEADAGPAALPLFADNDESEALTEAEDDESEAVTEPLVPSSGESAGTADCPAAAPHCSGLSVDDFERAV
jgi:hypothetical protein